MKISNSIPIKIDEHYSSKNETNILFTQIEETTDPSVVLLVALLEVQHPVAEHLECGGSEPTPYCWNLTVVKRTSYVIEFIAHSNLSSQCLHESYR